jgi:hypothetical protein
LRRRSQPPPWRNTQHLANLKIAVWIRGRRLRVQGDGVNPRRNPPFPHPLDEAEQANVYRRADKQFLEQHQPCTNLQQSHCC